MARTKLRTFRAPDELWLPALARSTADGDSLGAVLQAFLKRYGKGWSADGRIVEDRVGSEDAVGVQHDREDG